MERKRKIAWIVGGSGGIGSAIAYSLAEKGFDLGIGFYSSKSKAEQIVENCTKKYKIKAHSVFIDVSNMCSIKTAYDQLIYKLGHPSILIYAAGNSKLALFQDHSERDINELIEVHVKGAIYTIQTALPYLFQQKEGKIILLSSIWGEVGGAYEVIYSTAKGAQNALVKSLAKELAPSGITVNAVSPGAINTKMVSGQLSSADLKYLENQIPCGRLGTSYEVASLVGYLCTDAATYITGQIIRVSGGWDG